jgi:hypothetical protein
LRRRQEELTLLNTELDDTNRGVVALYAELNRLAFGNVTNLDRPKQAKEKIFDN